MVMVPLLRLVAGIYISLMKYVLRRCALNNKDRKLKDEIYSNPDLVQFVRQSIKFSIDNLHFFTTIKNFLRKAQEADLLLRDAVVLYEDDHNPQAALKKLREFKEVGNPFTKDFIEEFNLVGERLKSSFTALCKLKEMLDQKLLSVKAWRMVWSMAYYLVITAVTICSVLLGAVQGSGMALAFALFSIFMPLLENGVNWMFGGFQSELGKQKEVFETLERGTRFALDRFNCISGLLEKLKIEINSRIRKAELAIEKEKEAELKAVMFEIKHNAKSVADLENEIDYHARELNTAITELQKLVC